MEHVPPPAEELVLLDRELVQLDARRLQLLNRRAWLVGVLNARIASAPPAAPAQPFTPFTPPAQPFTPFAPPAQPFTPFTPPAPRWGPPVASPQAAGHGAQNVLLVLGGLLLTIAAVAFTLFSWGEMGIAGRSVALATVTLAALAAPAFLLRRQLTSTAEAVATLALVLTVLDAYALHAVVVPDTEPLAFSAVACAVLGVVWTAYGLTLRGLRVPLPAAVVIAQLPLVLWAGTADAPALGYGWALLVTAAADVAVTVWGKGLAVRVTAGAGASLTGPIALLVGLVSSLSAGNAAGAMAPGALLLAGAAVALCGGWRAPKAFAVVAGVVAGLAAVAGVGGVLRPQMPSSWPVVMYLLCGAALLTVVRLRIPRPLLGGLLGAAASVVACAVVWALPSVAVVLLGPVSLLDDVWSGAPEGFREALGSPVPWSSMAASPVVLALVAGLLAAVYAGWVRPVRPAEVTVPGAGVTEPEVTVPGARVRAGAGAGATALGWGALLVLLAVLDVPYAVAVGVQMVLVAALVAVAVRPVRSGYPAVATTALVCALAGSAGLGVLALAAEGTTYAVFGVLVVLFAGAAARSRIAVVQAVFACGAVWCAVVVTLAAGASLEWSAPHTAPVVLVVPAVTVLLGGRLRVAPVALAVEIAGAVGAVVAVALALTDAPFLALVLALCGVLATGSALRPERRPAAAYLAAALFVLAAWVRLAASAVTDPEAYTLPVSLAAFGVGYLRRRRDPAASSWTAYGPALSMTLLPSLVMAWGDQHWLRPLLLGAAALVVTLLGAHYRLRAPLLLGGSVLALDGLHELAPHVVQVLDALPRWAPPALVGLLLLGIGATYEQRLRDARRVRETIGRMR